MLLVDPKAKTVDITTGYDKVGDFILCSLALVHRFDALSSCSRRLLCAMHKGYENYHNSALLLKGYRRDHAEVNYSSLVMVKSGKQFGVCLAKARSATIASLRDAAWDITGQPRDLDDVPLLPTSAQGTSLRALSFDAVRHR